MVAANITSSELAEILGNHKQWLKEEGNYTPSIDRDPCAEQASFHGRQVHDLDLRNVNLSHFRADYSSLVRTSFAGAELQGSNFFRSVLKLVDFEGANLEYANLERADLCGSNLLNTNLSGATLQCSGLRGAQIDRNIAQCWSFGKATFSPDALPWLMLHPTWGEVKNTVKIIS